MFFKIQYLYNLQFIKTFADNMCVLSLKFEGKNGCKSIFHKYEEKKEKKIQKKVFVSLKVLFLAFLNTLKLCVAKCFIIFLSHL